MAQVYRECYIALKPSGVLAVVVKDFVRDGERVPFGDQTCELLEALGFHPLERIRSWLISRSEQRSLIPGVVPSRRTAYKSFFRRNAEQRGAPPIDWEEVIFFRK